MSNLLKLYEDHFSVLKIKEKCKIQNKLQFREASPDKVRKITQPLNKKKSAISSCIPVKHLTESVEIYLPFFFWYYQPDTKNGILPDKLKLVEVIPLLKKADPFDKINYRSVSLLLHVSKVFERIFNKITNTLTMFIQPSNCIS